MSLTLPTGATASPFEEMALPAKNATGAVATWAMWFRSTFGAAGPARSKKGA